MIKVPDAVRSRSNIDCRHWTYFTCYMTRASIVGTGRLKRWQLRLLAAFVGAATPASFAIAGAIANIAYWPFALLGVVPGLILGGLFGPMAARRDSFAAAAFFFGFVGWFVAMAIDLASFVIGGLSSVSPVTTTDMTGPEFQLGLLLFWGLPALILGGMPGSLIVSFITVGVLWRLDRLAPGRPNARHSTTPSDRHV